MSHHGEKKIKENKSILNRNLHLTLCKLLWLTLPRSSAVAERPRDASCYWIFR